MKPLTPQFSDEQTCRNLLADTQATIDTIDYIDTGRRSDNWKISYEDGTTQLLKILPPKEQYGGKYTPNYLATLHNELAKSGVSVPKILQTTDQPPTLLMEYVVAQQEKTTFSLEEMQLVAQQVAALHSATNLPIPSEGDKYSRTFASQAKSSPTRDYANQLSNQSSDILNWYQQAYTQSDEYFKDNSLTRGATHGDLRLENMIRTEDGVTLLDFETFKHNDIQVRDIATFIAKSLILADKKQGIEAEQTNQKIDAFLESYHKQHALSSEDVQALPTLIAARLFHTIALRSTQAKDDPNIGMNINESVQYLSTTKEYLEQKDFAALLGIESGLLETPKARQNGWNR